VALAILALGAGVPAGAAPAGEAVVVAARFSASMPERFGLDSDGDGLIDLPNTREYVQTPVAAACGGVCPPLFTLQLDGTASTARRGSTALGGLDYRWEITGPAGRHLVRRGAARVAVELPEGRYRVSLEVRAPLPWGSARGRTTREVVVEDVLVVALGDSYASGEGNPERPRSDAVPAAWADAPGSPAAEAAHAAAHRSTISWPALAALALERADPGTSVTFVSVAASAASVAAGLLGPQPGVSAESQIGQVADLVGGRGIDLLLLSVGGNEIGFARIVRGLVDADRLADPVCYETDLQNVWAAAADGDWSRRSALRWALPWGVGCRQTSASDTPVVAGLAGLPGELDRLAGALAANLAPQRVFLMEYPDPTGGGECPEIVGDVTPPFGFHEIDREEQAAARERVLGPLNRILEEAASRHGWTFVGGLAAAFASGHGYCEAAPRYWEGGGGLLAGTAPAAWYRNPAAAADEPPAGRGTAWYRTAAQSVILQGPDDAWQTMGTLHPNEQGHLAIAGALLQALAGD
jgi:hypothetical protein